MKLGTHTRATAVLAFFTTSALAQTILPVQSNDRPMGLEIIAPVNQAGSDEASRTFQENSLPRLSDFINENLGERQALENISALAVNPEVLRLNTDSNIRVYFLGEGAGYHNALGFSTEGGGLSESTSLIFPDASSANSYFLDAGNVSEDYLRTENTPLLPGDFVDLGLYEGGTSIDFLLLANGGPDVWSTDENYNADGIQHAVAFAVEGSPYLLIGFEDLYGGGDKDYNDLVFAVDIGEANVNFLSQPEPSIILLGLIPFIFPSFRRKFHALLS